VTKSSSMSTITSAFISAPSVGCVNRQRTRVRRFLD